MKEELVTLETAKLLKEKGFVWECERTISCDKIIRRWNHPQYISCCTEIDGELVEFLCPTLYVAQKWLRETKDLHIGICYSHKLFWYYEIMSVSNHVLVGLANRPSIHYNTYEEALEAGILECLKLI